LVSTFEHVPDPQALVVTDLAFNMGEHRLREFVHMITYFRIDKYTMAASELALVPPGWTARDRRRGGVG
jgi:hypothetical protein